MKGLYGRVNPLQGRLARAWEDGERAAGRCRVVFSQKESAEGGFARKPLASRYSTEPQQDTASIGEMKLNIQCN